jgi:hypothetical protein
MHLSRNSVLRLVRYCVRNGSHDLQRQHHVLLDRQPGQQCRILEGHADAQRAAALRVHPRTRHRWSVSPDRTQASESWTCRIQTGRQARGTRHPRSSATFLTRARDGAGAAAEGHRGLRKLDSRRGCGHCARTTPKVGHWSARIFACCITTESACKLAMPVCSSPEKLMKIKGISATAERNAAIPFMHSTAQNKHASGAPDWRRHAAGPTILDR